jgi:hypothetical protein
MVEVGPTISGMKQLGLFLGALLTGCASQLPPGYARITTDTITAPTFMHNACNGGEYTVDRSSTPPEWIAEAHGDRDQHYVVFHCNDGTTPRLR